MVRRRRLAKRLWSGFGLSGKDAAARRRRLRVEALEDRRLLALDFGDAPAPFPVTAQVDGARHEVLTNWVDSGAFFGGYSPPVYLTESYIFDDGALLGRDGGLKVSDDGKTILAIVGPNQVRLYRYEVTTESWFQKHLVLDFDDIAANIYDISLNDLGDKFAVAYSRSSPVGSSIAQWVGVYQFNDHHISQMGQSLGPFTESPYTAMSGVGNSIAISTNSNSAVQVMDWDGTYWMPRGSATSSPGSLKSRWFSLSQDGNRLLIPGNTNTAVYQWDEPTSSWDSLGGTLPFYGDSIHLASSGDKVGFKDGDGFSIYSLDLNLNWILDDDSLTLPSNSRQISVSRDFNVVVTTPQSLHQVE